MDLDEKFYTTGEVAKRYRIAEYTVRKWIRQGFLSAVNLANGSRPEYRVSGRDLAEFEARQRRERAV